MCAVKGIQPFLLTVAAVDMFCSMLAACGYAAQSTLQYLGGIYRQIVLMNLPISPELQQWNAVWSRAAKRDMGDSHRMAPIPLKFLAEMREFVLGPFQTFLFRMAVFTWFFLLRIDEPLGRKEHSGARRKQIFLDLTKRQVTVTLGAFKTNMEGAKCQRTHSCVCPHEDQMSAFDKILPLCPFCAAQALCVTRM